MKTRFICNVSNDRLLLNRIDNDKSFEAEYVIEITYKVCKKLLVK